MLSNVPQEYLKMLSVRDLETLLQRKRQDEQLNKLMERREELIHELKKIEEQINRIEDNRLMENGEVRKKQIVVKKRKTLKEHIVEILQEARGPLTASEIQDALIDRGLLGNGRNPRSFYNTVFQALQRYDIFDKRDKKYYLKDELPAAEAAQGTASLKDFVVAVLHHSDSPLKASEIASRVLIAGYKTDLDQDGLSQRVAVLMKKNLKKLFDWDSQRYRLINQS